MCSVRLGVLVKSVKLVHLVLMLHLCPWSGGGVGMVDGQTLDSLRETLAGKCLGLVCTDHNDATGWVDQQIRRDRWWNIALTATAQLPSEMDEDLFRFSPFATMVVVASWLFRCMRQAVHSSHTNVFIWKPTRNVFKTPLQRRCTTHAPPIRAKAAVLQWNV